ncbi:MAG: hypothetical protein JRH17_21100 [Deltaproteobacteria bacterium]|nr:hypothetical protein [Deltaproteobacteria bacterium]
MQSTRFSKTGISIAICRTPEASAFLSEMQDGGRLLTHEISEQELIESEGDALVFGESAYAWADLLRAQGLHAPELEGPNRTYARLRPRPEIERELRSQRQKQALMEAGRYRTLWLRKLGLESHRIAWRYLKWFVNRVLRLKKLTGRDRNIQRQDLAGFR